MTYSQWVDEHAAAHKKIIEKLLAKGLDKTQIIEYFDFENMKEKEPDFCPLYKDDKKCHEMTKLNCYLCSCPHFRYKDGGIKLVSDKMQFSYCDIDAKNGNQGVCADTIHQDCSKCHIPHTAKYVSKHFDLDWANIMKVCNLKEKEE